MAKIPGIDPRVELKRIEKEKEGNMERQSQLIDMMRNTPEDSADMEDAVA